MFFEKISQRLTLERHRFVEKSSQLLAPGTKILDVGAGTTRYKSFFTHCRYYAQDFAQHEGSSEGPLAAEWHYGKLDFVCDATDIPVDSASFDAVLCTEVIEHVPDPDLVLKEIGRVLKRNGLLILSAPLASGLHQEPHHFYGGYTPYYYKRKLGALGFVNINVVPNGGFYSFHSQETQRFSAWLSPWRLPILPAILLFPIWLVSLPWCRFIYPILAQYLDKFDTHKGFTVGYHVTATKN